MVNPSRKNNKKDATGETGEEKLNARQYLNRLGFAADLINSDPSLQVWVQRVRAYMRKNKGRIPTPYELDEMKKGIDWFERFNSFQQEARMQQADPRRRADWQRSLELERQRARNIAQAYGVEIDEDVIESIALEARLDGLNDQEIRNKFRPFLESTIIGGGELVGIAEDAERDLLQWSRANGLTLTGDTIAKYVKNIVENKQSIESVKDDLRQMYLLGQYPAWADRIKQGFDPVDIAGPYKRRIADLLEIDADDIGMDDLLLRRGLEGVGADGKPSVVPLYEFDRMVREDPRWEFTNNAYNTYAKVGTDLLRMFGFR
jgi:hypothetical protein